MLNQHYSLTLWGRVMHICVSKLTVIGSDKWLVAWTAPSPYLNQCWNIANWTLGNKLQWNLNQNIYIFIQENRLKMASILSRPQWVKVCYPALAREFQCFGVWGKFVFQLLELTDPPTNLTNQIKVGHALDQSHSVQSHGPERVHQKQGTVMAVVEDRSPTFDSFERIEWLYLHSKCGIKTKTHFEWLLWHLIFTRSVELRTHSSWRVAKCQLTSWRSVSKKPPTWVFII